jgi:hypothetical protein
MIRFTPRFKLIIQYDILPGVQDTYFQFIVNEFVPKCQSFNLPIFRAYRTAYGDYPERQIEFLAQELVDIQRALEDSAWQQCEAKLKEFVTNYRRRVLNFRDGFQL